MAGLEIISEWTQGRVPGSYDWLSFFLGGAFGSLVILGVERLVGFCEQLSEKKELGKTLNVEFVDNLQICDFVVNSLSAEGIHHSVFSFSRFKTIWLKKYQEKCINYGDADSLRLYSFLRSCEQLISRFDEAYDRQIALDLHGRIVDGFENRAFKNNQTMLDVARGIKKVIALLMGLRKNNKIYASDLTT
jgi:hypothetical protein